MNVFTLYSIVNFDRD